MSILEHAALRPEVSFRVTALPVPKGSMKAFIPKGWSRPVLTSTSKGLRDYATIVRVAAQDHVVTLEQDGMTVRLDFILPRPKSLPKKPRWHTTKPDLDKLARAVLDALTGLAWRDDSQVVALTCTKRYAGLTEAPGLTVRLRACNTADDVSDGL